MLLSMEVMRILIISFIDLSSLLVTPCHRCNGVCIVRSYKYRASLCISYVVVYGGTVSVVATLGIIKVAAIASSMVNGGTGTTLYHCDAACGK